ncbi:NADH-dependent butanol dehydrogenase A [hydrothermal vent metagenome]|uniref:NADH-dependent butanol dehydrogenase A n=1 Tax=hydrothermal vent metagenome TaxID=652676 RepID=A0A3B1CBX3_9ZZZZ
MNGFTFYNPTKILFGEGQIEHVGEETASIGKNVLFLTGGGSVKKAGLYDKVLALLAKAGCRVTEKSGIAPNPEIDSVREGAKLCRKEKIDVILAIGGGSVIDAAKAIAAGAIYDGDPWDFFDKKGSVDKPLKIGAVLTLSATGSEANGNTVVTNPETEEKRATYHPGLYPSFSILDPTLTFSVPREQTAYGAVDILSHVFEQYFHNVANTPLQDGAAEAIMRTVIDCAPVAMEEPDNYNARAQLMWASTLALNGLLSSGITRGDWACHIMGHEFSAKYGLAHGASLSIMFPSWMKYVFKANPERFAQFSKNVWGVDISSLSVEEAAIAGIGATKDFFHNTLGLGVSLSDHGIDGSRIEEMTDSATKHAALGSFVPLSREDVVNIYQSAL